MAIRFDVTGGFLRAEVSGVLSVDDLPPLFEQLEKADRRGPFVLLTDTSLLESAPRAVISQFAQQLRGRRFANWLGDAVVLSSPTIRFILATLLVIAPLPMTVKAFESRGDAERWCHELLSAAPAVAAR